MTKPNYIPGPKEKALMHLVGSSISKFSTEGWNSVVEAAREARDEIVATTRRDALKDAAKVSCGYCQNGFEVELKDGCEFTHNNGTTPCTAEYIWRLVEGWCPDGR